MEIISALIVIVILSYLITTFVTNRQINTGLTKLTSQMKQSPELVSTEQFSKTNLQLHTEGVITQLDSVQHKLDRLDTDMRKQFEGRLPNQPGNSDFALTKQAIRSLLTDHTLRGVWGEATLDTLLRNAGLVVDQHYSMQVTTKNDRGETVRPDCVLYSGETQIVIDSKFPAPEGDVIEALERHITSLAQKHYDTIPNTLLVILFLPIEINLPETLLIKAYNNNMSIATPATLLGALKLLSKLVPPPVADKDAVLELAFEMYERAVGLMKAVELVDSHIDKVKADLNKLKWHFHNRLGVSMRKIQKATNYSLQVPSMNIDTEIIEKVTIASKAVNG